MPNFTGSELRAQAKRIVESPEEFRKFVRTVDSGIGQYRRTLPSDAKDDIMNEIFLRLLEGEQKLEPPWGRALRVLAEGLAFNWVQKEGRRKKLLEEAVPLPEDNDEEAKIQTELSDIRTDLSRYGLNVDTIADCMRVIEGAVRDGRRLTINHIQETLECPRSRAQEIHKIIMECVVPRDDEGDDQ